MSLNTLNLLSLDLGITTGYAVHTYEGDLVTHGTIDAQSFKKDIIWVVGADPPETVVAERALFVKGKLGDELATVHHLLRAIVQNVVFVNPSDWKPTPYAKAKCPRGITQHERDAIRIGLWYRGTYLS